MGKVFIFILFVIGTGQTTFGQNLRKMEQWQDSLVALGNQVFQNPSEAERIDKNFAFVKTLVSSLKEPNSYFYAFEKLKFISILKPADNSFRIFSWNVPLQDGSYLYYGAIQFKSGSLKLTPLLDKTFEIADPNKDIVTSQNWYGAQYYEIIPLKPNQYILLGWKGHHAEYTKKVIDIINIDKDQVTFGAPIFSDDSQLVRKIFSYTRQATMLLKYNETNNVIEFDHIAPANPSLKDNYKYYGPDMTHDAYAIGDGKLIFKENIKLSNPENLIDDSYIDPKKGDPKKKSGLQ